MPGLGAARPNLPGRPVRVRMCPGKAYLLWEDGRQQPMPNDYFSGFVVEEKPATCPDGSKAKFFSSPAAATPQ
jgi:hypothetical protein